MKLDKKLIDNFVDITSMAAIACHKHVGKNDKIIDVVIVMTKIGNTYVFERDSGESIFDINYKKAPISDVYNEKTASKQIFNRIPVPTIKLEFEINDLDKRSLQDRNHYLNFLKKHLNQGFLRS